MALLTFKGTTAQVLAAITATHIDTATKVTITDNLYTIANLNYIIGATNNLPVILEKTAASIPFNDAAAGILTAIAGVNKYTGEITLTGTPSAAHLNDIAKGTTGKVTATLDPTTTIDAVTVAALKDVKTTDNITFKPTGPGLAVSGNSELTALINLKKLLPNANFTSITTIKGTESDVALIKSAQKLAADNAVVTITGQISAADANAIAKATDGALTATIKSGSVAATLKALADVDKAIDDITFTTTDKTVNARDLVKLGDKFKDPTNFDATSIETITENAKDVGVDAVNVTDALAIAANVDVKITGSISATIADLIALDTTGVVTATINSGTASNLLDALTDTDVNAYTITLLAGTAAAKDLTDLDLKTSVPVNANAISKITGSVAEIEAAYAAANTAKTISGLGNEAVEITAAGDTAEDVNKVLKLTTGVVTATVNAAAADVLLAALTDAKATDALTLTVTGGPGTTAAASDLKALDAKTSVTVNAATVETITGSAADIKTVLAAKTITTAANVAANVDGTVSAADANTITGATTGTVTATVAAGTAAALNKALVNANGTPVTGDNLTLTISKGTAAAADLIALDGKTLVNVNANAVTTITGNAADVLAALTATTIDTAAYVAATVSGTVLAADAQLIAAATTGKVTATIAAADAATLNGALTETDENAYTLTVNNAAGNAAAATVLNSLDAKTSVKVKVDAAAVTGAYADLEALYVINKANFANLGDEAVTITGALNPLASQVNTIAKATKGIVTATVAANTADVLVANLKDASATDKLTLEVNGASAKAADLNTLDGKTSENIVVNALNVTGNIADLTKLYITNADNFTATLGDETVEISGTVTAAQADSIADKTTAAVTANIAAATAASLNAALVDANAGANAYTLTVNGATAAATDLNALVAKTSEAIKVDAKEITGAQVALSTLFGANAASFTGEEKVAVKITDVTVAAADADAIADKTSGVVTATITAGTAAALNAALVDATVGQKTVNAYSLTVGDTAGGAAADDLNKLDAKTSVVVDAKAVTAIKGSAADIKTVLAAKTITTAANVKATVDSVISAADANTISKATTGVVTATVDAGTAAALKSALAGVANDGLDALTLTVTGTTAAAADLIALDAKTSVDVVVNATTVTGNIADVTKVLVTDKANFANLGDETVTISGTVSAVQANAIANATTGAVTATIAAETATALNTALVTNGDTTLNAYKLTVTGNDAAAAHLVALDGKTSVTVNAAAIKNIDGAGATGAAAVKAAYDANANKTISGLGNETVDLSAAADANASLVRAINDYTTGVITLDTLNTATAGGNFSLSQLGDLKGITGLEAIKAGNSAVDNITISIKDLLAANDNPNNFTFTITSDNDGTDKVIFTDIDTAGWTMDDTGFTAGTGGNITFTNTNSQVITITLDNVVLPA